MPTFLRQCHLEFKSLAKKGSSEPEEAALDADTTARFHCLCTYEQYRLKDDLVMAKKALDIAGDYFSHEEDILKSKRREATESARNFIRQPDSPFAKFTPSLSAAGNQYVLWTQVTFALFMRARARISRLDRMDISGETVEQQYHAAAKRIDECVSALNKKRIRHGSSQILAVSSLISRELNQYQLRNKK